MGNLTVEPDSQLLLPPYYADSLNKKAQKAQSLRKIGLHPLYEEKVPIVTPL